MQVHYPLSSLLYRWQIALAVFFAVWSLVYPSTWLVGRPGTFGIPGHLPAAPEYVAADAASIVRFGSCPLIRLLHCLGGGLWCITAVLQLSPSIRKRHRVVHRTGGRLFSLSAAAITAGYVLMELSEDKTVMVQEQHGIHTHTFYRPLLLWFTYTAVQAVAAAAQQDYTVHGMYCIRHVGAGLTFGLGRILVLLIGAVLHFSSVMNMMVQENKQAVFYVCSYSAACLSVGGCELLAMSLQHKGMPRRQPERNLHRHCHIATVVTMNE